MRTYHKDGTLPQNGEIFVFGSNLAGIHGAGAAAAAVKHFGAVYGNGRGLQGRSYAIPTKGMKLEVLPLHVIERDIELFVRRTNDGFTIADYFVTRVGCGFAGYSDHQIAPLFKEALNCSFAEEWREYLE